MGSTSRALAAAIVTTACWMAPTAATARQEAISPQAGELRQWVLRTRDHRARPFAIVDKRHARLHVFDAAGRERGTTPVLLGQALGDDIAPQAGANAQVGKVPFEERTTPAGRFETEPGINLKGEQVVWVDYESAFAIHRLRSGSGYKQRVERLASPTPADRRVSLGCVVVPEAFYLDVVQRTMGDGPAVVYVMPESGSMRVLPGAM